MKSTAAVAGALDDGAEDGHEFVRLVLEQGQFGWLDSFAVAEQFKPKNCFFQFFLTVAQRPGPRDGWIATATRWSGSLRRMSRPFHQLQNFHQGRAVAGGAVVFWRAAVLVKIESTSTFMSSVKAWECPTPFSRFCHD